MRQNSYLFNYQTIKLLLSILELHSLLMKIVI
jgi:hypothetical protein